MRLTEITALVLATTKDDWSAVVTGGPTFLMQAGPGDEYREHDHRWVLQDDVAIGLAFGMDANHGRHLSFAWSAGFDGGPDWINAFYVDILYQGQPVHRSEVLHVSAYSALLPTPRISTVEHDQGAFRLEYAGSSITDAQWQYACLVAALAGYQQQSQESCLNVTGLVVVQGDLDEGPEVVGRQQYGG